VGIGRSGLAAAAALQAGGAEPLLWDDNDDARENAIAAGFSVEDLTRPRVHEDLAALIVSPGIPHLYPAPHKAIQHAQDAGVPIDNDVGLFFGEMASWEPGYDDDGENDPRIICVTGSNGKSTSSALIHHILQEAGVSAQLGGNIGTGVLALEYPRADEVIVLELSSYQTDLARRLSPDVAVFLNLSPDHLDRHGGMGGYFAAKARLFEQAQPERCVIGIDEPEGRFLADRMVDAAEHLIRVSAKGAVKPDSWSVSLRKAFVAERRGGKQLSSLDLREAAALRGAHNGQNACAAYAACRLLGLGPKQIEGGLIDFPGLPHRLERIAEIGGVTYVNDSKATNADAAEKALLSYDNIRWIAGGVPKAGGIEPLLPLMERVKKTYLIGEAAESFAGTLASHPHKPCGTLDEAVALASADAEAGDTVLLAPACASFDQFASFEARGDAFRAIVEDMASKEDAA